MSAKPAKPKGPEKLWREIKRSFRQIRRNIDRGLRILYYPLLRWAYKKIAKKSEIVLSDIKSTETIVRRALKTPDIFKTCVTPLGIWSNDFLFVAEKRAS
jgi:hypothetical protein